MGEWLRNEISYAAGAKSIRQLNKGFSYDIKYVIDEQYLVRIFPMEEMERRKREFETLQSCSAYSAFVPKALEIDVLEELDKAYMILSYTQGEDGEVALKSLTTKQQYEAGFLAGKELCKLHQIPAENTWPVWAEAKKQKSDRYLKALEDIEIEASLKQLLKSYIETHEFLLQDRPNRFQHDDFHPSNIIIDQKQFAGLIDFQRMDFGDPIHDLQKLGFFAVRISVPFSRGAIDGYHNGVEPSESFWQLYALYSAMHVVSAIVWGKRMSEQQYRTLFSYSLDVINDHNGFTKEIPSWYKESE